MSGSTFDQDTATQDGASPAAPGARSGDGDVVRLTSSFDADGVPFARAVLTPDGDQRCKEIHCDPRPAIPVIFLPGVMGTLLANKNTGGPVWYPPNMDGVFSGISGAMSVIAGWFQSAVTRATRFDPEQAVVDPRGPVTVGGSGLSEEEAKRRGWNTLHRWSYQPTLAWLEHTLNAPMRNGQPQGEWAHGDEKGEKAALKAVLGTDPADYGGHGPGEPITADSDVFQSLVRYRYPVYAIGYNFLQSNEVSGQHVLDGVKFEHPKTKKVTRIMGIHEICRENNTDKAIIITHSMGGLVARMASQFLGGAKRFHGVIHGVQPATGAPVFAKRFRTGGEGFVDKSLLGRDDAEFVAIASNAEGPMELSPMPDYNGRKPWWIFEDKSGKEIMAWPRASALDELYISDAWYGLLPDSSILDPAGVVKKRLKREGKTIDVHEYFKATMEKVVDRQRNLINNYHPNTYAMYGDGALSPNSTDGGQAPSKLEAGLPDKKLQTWGTVIWRGDFPDGVTAKDLEAAELIDDDHHGVLTIRVRGQIVKVTVQQKAVAPQPGEKGNGIIGGDGTVPSWSAAAQGRGLIPGLSMGKANGVQMVFVQGGYDHQLSYAHPWSRWATLYSVAQIAHGIEESVR